MKKLLIITMTPWLLLIPSLAKAADSVGFVEENMVEIALGLVLLISLVVLMVMVVVLQAMKVLVKLNKPEEETVAEPSVWQKFIHSLTDSVPIEQEDEVMTDHAYDGIRELDNRLPPWWLYGFYFTIIFGFFYIGYYHIYKTGDLQLQEYEAEMAEAKEQIQVYLASLENSIDESNVELTTEATDLAFGKEAYIGNCVACHGSEGQGGVGPNFTDQYWINGGDINSIFKTIKYGVPEKGMIAWQNKFTPKQMQQLASYIITLEGTNPPNQKEPQGELYERKKTDETQIEETDSETGDSQEQAKL